MARLLNFFTRDSLTKRLEKVKQGDTEEREKIIKEYIPFIIKTVSDKLNRYIEAENSEELSIGIEAFNEAIDRYEPKRGNFIGFAELVIKNRIIDELRKSSKHKKTILISQFEEDDNEKLQKHFSVEDFTEKITLKEEIKEFEEKLKIFQITFSELVQEAPKHMDTRINGIRIAQYIVDHKALKEELFRKKMLPSKKLIDGLGVSAKILKRSRKFIIATVIILEGDFEKLRNYIGSSKGGVAGGL
ncbi:RNA polymerase sigma-I factor [Crassaminicella profunda]|uniref:RNA polymerase sigma-I factor n=1 Tax=Crassaminicella profunda TaxID=1286698 RepID=UPI001CA6CEE4|nr:RNA polymerase sigma-I factor [Crassaminicella profunda]QZY54241.1 RNA polymerase sigma-I factor [Crassaminicella profunda]